MNFVDEQNVALREVGQKRGQIARLFNRWAGGDADVHTHFIGNDTCKRGLAQARRAIEQDVIQRLVSAACRLDIDREVLLDLLLSIILAQALRPEGKLALIFGSVTGRYDGRFKIL